MSFCNLVGKRALVTGGSRGIGMAIAKELRNAGADVVISGTNVEALKKTADTLGATYFAADLGNKEHVEGLAKEVGDVDILVNNAGITRDGLFMRQSDDAWDSVLRVNLDAAVCLTRAIVPNMTKKQWGRIINISSIVAHMGNVGQTNYITSKAALTGFTKGLAKEVARRNITVNCVAPGFIHTDMTASLSDKMIDKFNEMIAAQKFGTPEDIAAAVRFLASEEAGYMTGTTLHVNGGMYM